MNAIELPPLDLVLTPAERSRAAEASVHLERNRREQNARDEAQQRAEKARAAAKALENFDV